MKRNSITPATSTEKERIFTFPQPVLNSGHRKNSAPMMMRFCRIAVSDGRKYTRFMFRQDVMTPTLQMKME